MKIFQFNVRLAEGGAAGIALDLHLRAMNRNYNSKLVYGYGKRGKKSESHDKFKSVYKNTNLVVSFFNLLTYQFTNKDIFGDINNYKKEIINYPGLIVLHFHVIHSYWLNFEKLVIFLDELIKVKKNVRIIWTLHDHWAITGRCAFLDGCERWKENCYSCPIKTNYPPVKLDEAANRIKNKRLLIKKLLKLGCIFISPSEHVSKDFNLIFGNNISHVINNGIDIASEQALSVISKQDSILGENNSPRNQTNFAIVAHDLSYQGKTDYNLINNILHKKKRECIIHTFGKHSPFSGDNVRNHGYFNDKATLMTELKKMDGLIFTSKVDNYPLILCEAMSLGVPVVSLKSAAANEVLKKVGGKTFDDKEIIQLLNFSKADLVSSIYGLSIENFITSSKAAYSGERMLDEYVKYYENI